MERERYDDESWLLLAFQSIWVALSKNLLKAGYLAGGVRRNPEAIADVIAAKRKRPLRREGDR